MNLFDSFCKLTQDIGREVTKRSPELLAGAGIACFVASTVSAVKVTPEAAMKLEKKKKELNMKKLPVKETVKEVGKLYLPAALTGVAGVAFIGASVSESNRRYVALSTSYELLKDASYTYRAKVIETLGEKKDEKIRDAINQDKIDENPPVNNVNIYQPKEDGTYKCLFYEPITNRYFWERREKVELAIAKAYKEIQNSFEEEISVYNWLDLLPEELKNGLPDGTFDKYTDMGWTRTNLYDGLEISIVSGGVVHGGEYDGYPCLVLEYSEQPSTYFKSPY